MSETWKRWHLVGAAVGIALFLGGPSFAREPFSTAASPGITSLPPAPIEPRTVADLKAIQERVEAVVREAEPATVAILLEDAQGSGVIVSKDGYVLTAGHVSGTPGQPMIVVLANGKKLQAKALGANNGIDSGMIKILNVPKEGLPYVPLGTDRNLKAGEWVVAMGHPGGYRSDRPPVVRLGRVLLANKQMIGTDCPLISGDSGGPVFDLDGRLIGINSRIGQTLTTNIHVPVDTFEETWDRLAQGDEWGGPTGFLGREHGETGAVLGINGGDAPGGGALVRHVKPGSAAAKAGLRPGDVVTVFENHKIRDVDDLADRVGSHAPGDTVLMLVRRGAERLELKMKLGG